MIVSELIALLQKADPRSEVTVRLESPKDAGYSKDVSCEMGDDGKGVTVSAWCASDDEEAWFPDGS